MWSVLANSQIAINPNSIFGHLQNCKAQIHFLGSLLDDHDGKDRPPTFFMCNFGYARCYLIQCF